MPRTHAHLSRLPNTRFRRFWVEVDAQLASLGATDAWGCEVQPRFDDRMSVNEAALAIIEARAAERPYSDANAEHRLTARELGVGQGR